MTNQITQDDVYKKACEILAFLHQIQSDRIYLEFYFSKYKLNEFSVTIIFKQSEPTLKKRASQSFYYPNYKNCKNEIDDIDFQDLFDFIKKINNESYILDKRDFSDYREYYPHSDGLPF